MLTKRQLVEEQRDCANMLGLSLKQYQDEIKNIKAPNIKKRNQNKTYDNSILSKLGLSEKDLKIRKEF